MKKLFVELNLLISLIFLGLTLSFPTFLAIAAANNRPERIVSISPSLTEILFAIGAGQQVVAVDNISNYPPDAPTSPLSAMEPNMEAIATFEPDLVVLSYDIGGLVKGLNTIGINTILLPAALNFEEILNQIIELGQVTGNLDQARELVEEMNTEMTSLISMRKSKVRMSVYHEIDENYYSPSTNSFIGSIYRLLNLHNIADQADKDGVGYPKLSPEYILSSNPGMIILPGKTPEYVAKLKNRPGWSAIDAVKQERFLIIDPDIGSRWGPRIVAFAKAVVARSDLDEN
ncbi:MAG: ABC transporter substrate-binding protein [Pseudomonadota bacterium]|nr:ABC transporter substrate-binding protein [Pseudomonadota bacterium]